MTPRRDQAGFALVETLIATAIIAVMVATVAGIVARNGQAVAQVTARREAMLIARSALDQAASGIPDGAAGHGGDDGTYAWTVAIEPYGALDGSSAPPVERISVVVTDRTTRHPLARLATLRFAR